MLDQLCPTSLLQGRSLVDGHDHLGAANKRSLIRHGVEGLNIQLTIAQIWVMVSGSLS